MTREEAIKHLLDMQDGMPSDKCADWIQSINMTIEALSAQKTGRWLSTEAIDSFGLPVEAWKCSECGKVCNENWRRYPKWNYCPHCGAYMKGAEDAAN